MNFLFTINNDYIEPVKLLIYTIEFNKISNNNYYFIYRNIDTENRNVLISYADKFGSKAIFVEFNCRTDVRFDVWGGWSEEIYYRLFAPYILNNVNMIIYLDGDTIVNGKLEELTNIEDFEKYTLAAVPNDEESSHKMRLGLSNTDRYYNSGVLVMNLKLMREMFSEEDIIDKLMGLKKQLVFPDQDFINIVYKNTILSLTQEYNYMINVTERSSSYPKLCNYKICHFVLSKPWNYEFKYRTDKKYLLYMAMSGECKKAIYLWYRHRKFRLWCRLNKKL